MPKVSDIGFSAELSDLAYLLGARDGNFLRFPASLFKGHKWHVSYALPVDDLGDDGDMCLDIVELNVYQKTTGSWGSAICNIKGSPGTNGVSPKEIYYNISGSLTVSTGKLKRHISANHAIAEIKILLGTAAAGADIMLDVLRNGIAYSICSSGITIPKNTTEYSLTVFSNNTLTAGDYLTVSINQVGSSNSGSDLSMVIILQ